MIKGSLYSKYRPKVFEEVYGQKYISEILKNQIKYKKIAHAYLFSGTRGTGKTTCARIFAKAINCIENHEGNPCYKCSVCSDKNNNILNVIELDAASNNSVDQIRSLIEELKYSNFTGGYKVYILDEVHMLSMSAFNALLKTLEEPPENVVFILSTTELRKIPQTIISRCQKFEFKNIESKDIISRLSYITESEGIHIDEESLEFIAYMGNGSMRDSISVLERVLLYTDSITIKDVREILGVVSSECIFDFLGCLFKKDSYNSIKAIANIFDKDLDIKHFISKIRNVLRDLMFIKIDKIDRGLLIEKNNINVEKMENLIRDVDFEYIRLVVDEINNITNKQVIEESEFRVKLEIFIIKFCNNNEKKISNNLIEQHSIENKVYVQNSKKEFNEEVTKQDLEQWKKFLVYLKESKYMVIYSLLQYGVIDMFTNDRVNFKCNTEGIYKRLNDINTKKQIEEALKKYFGRSIFFQVSEGMKKIEEMHIEDKIKNFFGSNVEIENK